MNIRQDMRKRKLRHDLMRTSLTESNWKIQTKDRYLLLDDEGNFLSGLAHKWRRQQEID